MENITNIPEDELRKQLDAALLKLVDARDEIMSLNKEVNELRELLDRCEHEDEVVITTKHKIRSVDLYFEEGTSCSKRLN